MGLEAGTYISDLVSTNPVGATDQKAQGDDHIRLIKATLLATFPNITGAVTLTHGNINDAALKSANNTLTGINTLSAANVRLSLVETDAAADQGAWLIRANGDTFYLSTATDAAPTTAVYSPIIAARSGTNVSQLTLTAVTEIELNATTFDLNGALDLSGRATIGTGIRSTGLLNDGSSRSILIETLIPRLGFYETDGPSDEKHFYWQSSSGVISMVCVDDSLANPSYPIRVLRTGVTIDEIELNGTSINVTGAVDVTGALDVAGVITGTAAEGIESQGSSARFYINETDQAADEKVWALIGNGSTLDIRAYNDARSSSNAAIRLLRTTTTIDEVELNATLIDINGAVDLSSTLDVTGNATFGGASNIIQRTGGNPRMDLYDDSAASNEGRWFFGLVSQELLLATATDGGTVGDTVLTTQRGTGNTLANLTLGDSGMSGSTTIHGTIAIPEHGTTASAANAFINSGTGALQRSTSSRRYKKNIRTLDTVDAEAILALRPVAYQSRMRQDGDGEFVGFVAEEVAEIDPRLVFFHDGRPDGVQYDRVTVGLVGAVQAMRARIAELEARVG